MLRDEVAKYTELTGEDGNHTPIMKIGAYLDGYEKGLSILDEIRAEMEKLIEWHDCPMELDGGNDMFYCIAVNGCIGIIDKYRLESESSSENRTS